jgi:carbon monoxide dehydrogenase subunit G
VRDAAGVAVERTPVELQHSFTVPAGVEKAWATLLDLEGVAPCFPGATLTGTDGHDFTGQVKVKLGPVSLQYAGRGRFVERDDAGHRAVIEAHGSDKRGNGTAGVTVVAHLEAEGEEATRVVVSTQLKVTGRPAQFGRVVMQDVGSRIVDQFAVALARLMSGGGQGDAAGDGSVAGSGNGSVGGLGNGSVGGLGNGSSAASAAADGPASTAAATAPSSTATAPGARHVAAPVWTAEPESMPEPGLEQPPRLADATAPVAAPRPAAPRPTSLPRGGAPAAESEPDLNAVVLPVLARQYGPTLIAVLLTAVVTWWIARRRR